MLRVGLTGGIGSGKSTVAALFATRGVPVIDTDEIARQLTDPAQPAFPEILRAFGREILNDDLKIDRNKLRERIFNNTDDRHRLESILHPYIRETVQRRLVEIDAAYCIVVVPLLIESDFMDLVDRVLVVDATEANQITRTNTRSGLNEPEIRKIMAAQVNRADRLQKANEVIENNADKMRLEAAVEHLHQWYLSLAATTRKN